MLFSCAYNGCISSFLMLLSAVCETFLVDCTGLGNSNVYCPHQSTLEALEGREQQLLWISGSLNCLSGGFGLEIINISIVGVILVFIVASAETGFKTESKQPPSYIQVKKNLNISFFCTNKRSRSLWVFRTIFQKWITLRPCTTRCWQMAATIYTKEKWTS